MYLFFCLTNLTSLYSTYTNVDCVDDPVKVHNVNDKLCTTVMKQVAIHNHYDTCLSSLHRCVVLTQRYNIPEQQLCGPGGHW